MPCSTIASVVWPLSLLTHQLLWQFLRNLKRRPQHSRATNAALVIADPLVQWALQVAMVPMAQMVMQVPQAIVVLLLRMVPPKPVVMPNHARANQEHLVKPDLKDQRDQMDHLVTLAPMAVMVNLAEPDQKAHPAHLALLETPAQLVHQATLEKSIPAKLVPQAQPVLLANPVHLVLLVNQAAQEKMVALAVLVLQEMQVHQETQAKLEAPVLLANLARMVHPVVANIVHQLVWLQVIKIIGKDRTQ